MLIFFIYLIGKIVNIIYQEETFSLDIDEFSLGRTTLTLVRSSLLTSSLEEVPGLIILILGCPSLEELIRDEIAFVPLHEAKSNTLNILFILFSFFVPKSDLRHLPNKSKEFSIGTSY